MLRSITLSLLMLVSIGVMLPFEDSTAHGIRQSAGASRRGHYRRHSRAWWRRYRARLRRRRAAALAHRNAPLAPFTPTAQINGANTAAAVLPKLPAGWNTLSVANSGELKFRTGSGTGTPASPGQASLSVVALARPAPAYLTVREQRRLLSGVAFSDLRRIVIDKMIATGGWVINDYERVVNGSKVFVVTAQTPSDGRSPQKSWNFYFTEVQGRIYSLTTNTPVEFSDRMSAEAERFIESLHPNSAGTTRVDR
ncbi:MAG TPA: hypothetical protein VJ124_19640 [Pyrinomonadaceae bacterium]|nr:hypothetical protein [Pyrinomonadaceae bacterium]